jgi:Uma2 family endonuclease
MTEAFARRRFSVHEYHRMGETGILAEDERVELLAGDIIVREPIGTQHAGTVNRLTYLWTSRLGLRAVVQVQNPIELAREDSEPQPDLSLLRPRADFYATAHPAADDVLLAIEVADTSLRLDRRVKIPLYARAGIGEAWLVDLTTSRIEVYREPTAEGYRDVQILVRGQSVTPNAFADLTLAVGDLLG